MPECPPMPPEIAQDAPNGAEVGKEPRKLSPEERNEAARTHGQLVVRWAEKLAIPGHAAGLDKEELCAYGWRGFAHALERFDPSQGITIGAFAGPWVRGAMLRGIKKADRAKKNIPFVHPDEAFPGASRSDSSGLNAIPARPEPLESDGSPKAVICLMVDVSASMPRTRVQSIRKLIASQAVDKVACFSADDAEWIWDRDDERQLVRSAM